MADVSLQVRPNGHSHGEAMNTRRHIYLSLKGGLFIMEQSETKEKSSMRYTVVQHKQAGDAPQSMAAGPSSVNLEACA